MPHAPIHKIKAQLSHYLNLVQHGKIVIVTSHNRPIAQIIPIETNLKAGIDYLLATGLVKWNGEKPKGARIKLKGIGKSAAGIVLEDRS